VAPECVTPVGRVASGRALAPEPPCVTRFQPEFIPKVHKTPFIFGFFSNKIRALCSAPGAERIYIRLSLQLSLTLACIKALFKILPNIHGASHIPAPPRAPADVVD